MKDCYIRIPQELAAQYGLSPDVEIEAAARPDGVLIRRAPDHLAKIYVEVTSHCNLACEMCVRNAWDEPLGSMSLDLFKTLMDQLADFPRPLTMMFACYGEPLSHPDLLTMISLAKGAGLRVELTTNGILLDQEMARSLIKLAVDRVWVSIDGVTARRYAGIRLGAELATVRKNLQGLFVARIKLESCLPTLGLAFVAMKSNIAELPDLYRLAARVRATDVLVTNLLPHTPDMVTELLYQRTVNLGSFARPGVMPRVHMPRLDINEVTAGPIVSLMRNVLDLTLTGALPEQRSDFCPFVQAGALAVRWDGAVSPCPPLLHTHPEYGIGRWRQIKHASFGNIAGQPLAAIWNSPAYANFRCAVHAFDFGPCTFCGGCERADGNEEDCFGNTFPVCGGCLWAQDIVRCP